MADNMRGRFVWHELMTPDPKAAVLFYGKVAGWTPKPYDKNPDYTMLTYNGMRMGGVLKHDAPRLWLPYIASPNVDVTAREAVELGGEVVKPAADIPDVGRFAMIKDPQGALFVAFTPLMQSSGPRGKPGLGDFHWHELLTTDWQKAWNFYQKLFGWHKTDAMEMSPGESYQMFAPAGEESVGGMFNKPAQSPGPAQWLSYSIVKDAKAAAKTIEAAGGKVINGPMEVPGGDWITAGIDPQGVTFAVHSRKDAAAAKPAATKPAATKPAATKPAAAKQTAKPKKRSAKAASRTKKAAKRTTSAKGRKQPKKKTARKRR
jgi:predicted enzyme related to lactoylglutathione lyase